MTIGVAIPSIPERASMLARAVKSVMIQSHPVHQISVALDVDYEGAGRTRNRALLGLNTEWTCFLDDDDELLPIHVETLVRHQAESGADAVFPAYTVHGGSDPFPAFKGLPWDPAAPRSFPITAMVRTDLAKAIQFADPQSEHCAGEDYHFWLEVNRRGTISHVDVVTWIWRHHHSNTSGSPARRQR